MKRSFGVIFAVFSLVFLGGLFIKQDASAYWYDKDGKQCFAVRYGYSNAYKDEGKAADSGKNDEYAIEYKAYSTEKVCATKDNKGKVTMKLEGYPSDNDQISKGDELGLRLYIADSGKTLVSKYCKKTGKACENGTAEVKKTYKLSNYKDFKELAKAVVNDAPSKYGKAKKGPLNDKYTKTKMKEEAEKKKEDLSKNGGSGNSNILSEGSGDPCYNADTNSLGWIMCPVMRTLENAATWLDSLIEEWLSVDTSLYNASSPTATVWEIMRNIANIIIVIILLVIIFSQLTGVGIDNYGIKKMLPRLIAMAILINLSLIVCELAVDLSNLLGTGLKNLFGSIGERLIEGKGVEDHMSNFVSTMVTALLAMVAGLGAVAPFGLTVSSIALSGSGMIIVVLVLALLVVVAAVLVFFVMLGARMVIIIGCVAIAPVALAFYILPNTQELYKKWLNAFKTALVIFPICGVVSGIGTVIRAIVLSADEIQVWMGVIGIVAPFLAFFMLPSMLRGVLGTLGKMGEALTTMGQGVRNGARGVSSAVQNSDRFKAGMKYARDTTDLRRAEGLQRRYENRGLGNLSQRQMNRYARATTTADSINKERRNEQTLAMDRRFANAGMGQLMDEWNHAFDSGNTEELSALTNVLTKRYGAGAAGAIGQSLAGKHNIGDDNNEQSANYRASLQALRQTMSENNDFAGQMRNKASDAYQMISDGGRANIVDPNTGESRWGYADLSYFSGHNNISSNHQDWSTQSAETIQRALDNGALTADDARALLNSTDSSIQSGLQSDHGKRDVLQNYLYTQEHNPQIGPPIPPVTREEGAANYRREQENEAQRIQRARQAREERDSQNLERLANHFDPNGNSGANAA